MLHRKSAIFVDPEDIISQAGPIDVVLEDVDSVRLGYTWEGVEERQNVDTCRSLLDVISPLMTGTDQTSLESLD